MNDLTLGISYRAHPPLDNWPDRLRDYESAGWDTCWMEDSLMGEAPLSLWDPSTVELARFQETPNEYFDTLSMLSHAAAETDRIRLGVGVTDPLRRPPIVLAQTALTIHHLSAGRMVLGLSAGTRMMTDPYGIEYHRPVSHLEEALQIIRIAWEAGPDEPFDFDGEFWQLEDALFALPPVEANGAPPHPEIFLGAHGSRMRSLTGRYADGWLPTFLTPELYAEGWETVEKASREAGRAPAEITRGLFQTAVFAETREKAREMLDSTLVRIGAVFLPPQAYEACGYDHPLGVGQTSYVPTRVSKEEALDLAASVPLEVLENAYLWGTTEDVIAAVEEFAAAGVDHISLSNSTPLAAPEQTGASFKQLDDVRQAVQQRT